jgi:hypothetical protein
MSEFRPDSMLLVESVPARRTRGTANEMTLARCPTSAAKWLAERQRGAPLTDVVAVARAQGGQGDQLKAAFWSVNVSSSAGRGSATSGLCLTMRLNRALARQSCELWH